MTGVHNPTLLSRKAEAPPKCSINNKDAGKYRRVKPELQLYALQYQLSPAYEAYLREALAPTAGGLGK